MSRLAFAAAVALTLAACDAPQTAESLVIPGDGPQLFQNHRIPTPPPGGDECCTDVSDLADVNGDGYLDLVAGGEGEGWPRAGLAWYEYPTWERHPVGRGEFTTDGQAVDFDRDGDIDIVIGDISEGLVWFEQAGSGKWKRHFIVQGYVHDLHVADLDANGLDDVVVADKTVLKIVYRDANGRFRVEVVAERAGEGLDVADLDADGDLDILYSNTWLENVATPADPQWRLAIVAPDWTTDTRTRAADVDRDGRLDVVLTGSEGESAVAWFARPSDGVATGWIQHRISRGNLVGAHSLVVGDIDLDGSVDVVAAEMHTSPEKRIVVFLQGESGWTERVIAAHGSHNLAAADVDADGDIDLVGKNYAGEGRFLEYWENRARDLALRPAKLPIDRARPQWNYDPIDARRPASDRQKFGLVLADANSDGHVDVAAGGSLYVNRASDGDGWLRLAVDPAVDLIHVTRRTTNGWAELVGVSDKDVVVAAASDSSGHEWKTRSIASIPEGRTQGWAATETGDGRQALYFTRDTNLFRLDIPPAHADDWRLRLISDAVQEEGVALGDIDADGEAEIVATSRDSRRLLIIKMRDGEVDRVRRVGASLYWLDRVEIADLDADGRNDIVFTEENGNGRYDARVGWLEAPPDPWSGTWRSHTIAVLRSANSMTVADHDSDGDVDVYVAEHTDTRPGLVADDNFTAVFLNSGDGSFDVELVEFGDHSSHLGARAADLDGDGVPEIVSAGWEQDCCLHRWSHPEAAEADD